MSTIPYKEHEEEYADKTTRIVFVRVCIINGIPMASKVYSNSGRWWNTVSNGSKYYGTKEDAMKANDKHIENKGYEIISYERAMKLLPLL